MTIRRVSHLFKNSVLLFTACRYFVYGLFFIRGILVAKALGPYLFGVWGFLVLVQAYLSYVGIGAHYAINVQLSTQSEATDTERDKRIGIALSLTSLISVGLILAGLAVQGLSIPVFEKYHFRNYAFALGLVAGFNQMQQVLTNIYRVYGGLARIALVELLGALGPLSAVLIFRGELLVQALLVSLVCAGLFSVIILLIKAPFRLALVFESRAAKELIALGIPLVVYNVSFYFITIAAQTVISVFYPVEVMGYYSLANSVTSAILLGVNSVIWVFFPNILSRTREGLDEAVVASTIRRVNDLFGTAVCIVSFLAILVLPTLFIILPQYKASQGTLTILLLSQTVFSLCVGHNCIAIARNQQMAVARISLVAVAIVTVLCVTVGVLHLPFIWVSTAVLIGAMVFTIKQVAVGARLLDERKHSFGELRSILPYGSVVAILVSVAGSIVGYPYVGGLLGSIIYAFTNHLKLRLLWNFGVQRILRTGDLSATSVSV